MFNFSPLSVWGLGYSVPSIFLIIYRTKVESSRETPDFVSECMASVLLFVNLEEAMHLDFASLQFFAQKKRASSFHCRCSLYVFNYFQRSVPPVHNIVSSLNLCFCWTVPQITFPFNSKNNFQRISSLSICLQPKTNKRIVSCFWLSSHLKRTFL